MENARALERAGAAIVIPEDELTPRRMVQALHRLVSEPGLLATMRDAALTRARPEARAAIAADIARVLPPRSAA